MPVIVQISKHFFFFLQTLFKSNFLGFTNIYPLLKIFLGGQNIMTLQNIIWADCGSDHELLIAKFRLKLKKVGKTTRPFRCDLNEIPYDYTVEVRNRFKGLDLIDRVPDDVGSWHCTGDRDQDHPQEKEMQKSKMAVWVGITDSCEKKRSQKQRRKGKIYSFECRVPKNSKER